ncbi:MAG: GTPase HflX [Deltaproteobacteria bacterium]|nr:GTPase HflX [Deltaproteobacteria bacterium]
MEKIFGNTSGLSAREENTLLRFYRRQTPPEAIIHWDMALAAGRLSRELRRQIGFLIDRAGTVHFVIVGDYKSIHIPSLAGYRYGLGRLKGLRFVHTHLDGEPLTEEDLTDLTLLRLDFTSAIEVGDDGIPRRFHAAHPVPHAEGQKPYRVLDPIQPSGLDLGVATLISELEGELERGRPQRDTADTARRAILVSVTGASRTEASTHMDELVELAKSAGIAVAGTVIQHRAHPDPKTFMGQGKLKEIGILIQMREADLLVFDQNLSPSQISAVSDFLDIAVIDRTQLILDIFAQRAHTREGKLQVELAQLKYLLPRLVGKNPALSRLAGGIGTRGPGESKLEIDRRRAHERIERIEKELSLVKKKRGVQRGKREKAGLPVVSIVGYTNAGKSTLLNVLTGSVVIAEDKLFATLDPSSRRLRFPREREIIITDTVGFIRDLPKDLVAAFSATLEELIHADLLLHVMDAENPRLEEQIASVEKILAQLELDRIPVLRVLNKCDLLDQETIETLVRRHEGMAVSAKNPETLPPLLFRMEEMLFCTGTLPPGHC